MAVCYLDQKGNIKTRCRPQSRKRKHRPLNRYEAEKTEQKSVSASARKIKTGRSEKVEVNKTFGYRILHFAAVFSIISSAVKCQQCDGPVKFYETGIRGLGFKLLMTCRGCKPRAINSCPLINGRAYEINRRISFVFRLFGVGMAGIEKFCGLMDLPRPVFHSMYSKIMNKVQIVVDSVAQKSMKLAAEEEKEKNKGKGNKPGLSVSGDGTWMKRGHSSLYGVTSIIGYYSGKVLDYVVKSAYCKACAISKKALSAADFSVWKENHQDQCNANHEGSSGKMEVDAVVEMFMRSKRLHSAEYHNYIGDGDCKTHTGIVKAKPYKKTAVKKKECICHVQKRMGSHLRKVRKEKKLGGAGKLTMNLINELTIYFGLAIRRNTHSSKDMRTAIWATYYHKISTDKKPQHQHCSEDWCSYKKAKKNNTLKSYKHKDPLPNDVQKAIRPIYELLTSDDLLTKCEGGFTQNNNESLNSVIWSMAPKTSFCGKEIVDIATGVAVSTFNDGYTRILLMMQLLNLKIGSRAYEYCQQVDERRITHADFRTQESTKESRKRSKDDRKKENQNFKRQEGSLYGAGTAD